MDISKDEIYQIVKESIEKETEGIAIIIGFITLVAIASLFAGIIQLNIRLTIGSTLAILLVGQLSKYFNKIKEELIRKLVKEHDKKTI